VESSCEHSKEPPGSKKKKEFSPISHKGSLHALVNLQIQCTLGASNEDQNNTNVLFYVMLISVYCHVEVGLCDKMTVLVGLDLLAPRLPLLITFKYSAIAYLHTLVESW
jgi:hypothetical protein